MACIWQALNTLMNSYYPQALIVFPFGAA